MKHKFLIIGAFTTCLLSGCYFNYGASPFGSFPICRSETTVAVYDKNGAYEIPGCIDYKMVDREEFEAYMDEFPYVENNKYHSNQVVMENLNTRVLAYCRGTEMEIAYCVERLEMSCYTRINEIPYMPARYDFLKQGTYPTRRWRNGENVPRW